MSFDLEIRNGDLQLKTDGTVKTIEETVKLRQDILKIIMTSLGSNKFHPWYGCAIADSAIGKNYPDNLLFSEVRTSILQSLDKLKTLQMAQATGQNVSLSEMIAEIERVDVERNPSDMRQISVVVVVWTKRLGKIEEVFTVIS